MEFFHRERKPPAEVNIAWIYFFLIALPGDTSPFNKSGECPLLPSG